MSAVGAVMSAASSCSSVISSLQSRPFFTPSATPRSAITGATALLHVAAKPPNLNTVAASRPLVAICRLPPPAAGSVSLFFSLARTSSRATITTPAASYGGAATYSDEEGYDNEDSSGEGYGNEDSSGEGYDDEEWDDFDAVAGDREDGSPTANNRKQGKRDCGPDAGRLYVGNLPYSMTEEQLAEAFSEAGSVRSVEIVYDRVTDRSRGFAFVTMDGVEEAEDAIRLFNGAQVGGRTVKVNFPEVPRGGEREVMGPRVRGIGGPGSRLPDGPYKVYVGNLEWSVTSEVLSSAFEVLPGFVAARIVYERDTGRSRGFGFVSFTSEEEAQSAMESMDGVELEGRPMRVNTAVQRMATSS